MANTLEAAAILREQPIIARTLNLARQADITLVGIGGITPESCHYLEDDLIPAEALDHMAAQGAVGDISGKFITVSGELYDCEYNQRIIGITLDDLRRIPNTVAVAMGPQKLLAILGALRTGVINTLCTDQRTASDILHSASIGKP
jgi:DNA-binding transcriptional regulator LsrR (DeoR family)